MFFAVKKSPLLFVFALFTAVFLSSLGCWQLERGQELEASNKLKALNAVKQVLDLNKHQSDAKLEDGLNVTLTGRFVANKDVLHDNRLNSGKSGYHIFGIFKINETQSILVNRGWVKMDLDRRILPNIITRTELVNLTGVIRYPVKNVYTLAEEVVNSDFPKRVQTINIDQITKASGIELQEYSVLLEGSVDGEHFDRNWINLLPGKYMTANKHYAYSLQWFSLALVALVTFMILIFKLAKNEQR